MVDVYVSAHSVGHQYLMSGLKTDAFQACQQSLAAGAAPVSAGGHVNDRHQHEQSHADDDPLRVDPNIVHSSAAATASRVGGRSRKCRGNRSRRLKVSGISMVNPRIGSTTSLNFAG